MSHPEGVTPDSAELGQSGQLHEPAGEARTEVNRAEEIFEEAAKRVATGDVADLDTALRQYHNQVVAETGDQSYSFDAFSSDVVERADSLDKLLKAPPAATEITPAVSPVVSPDQAGTPEVTSNPAEQIIQTAAQELAAGTMDETKLHEYQAQARAAGLPGNDLGIFATEIANRANAIRASQRPAEPESAVPAIEQAAPEQTPEFASLGAAAATKEAAPGWTVPQPAADPLLRRGDGTFRTVSAEERGKAEQQYIDTRTQIEATQARLENKYARLPKAQREEKIRADKEMQPLLRELDRAKDVLTSVIKEKPVPASKAEKPNRQRREKAAVPQAEPPSARADQETDPTPAAPQPKIEPEEPGVLNVSGDILGGMSSPETRATAQRLAEETPAGPMRDRLQEAARGGTEPVTRIDVRPEDVRQGTGPTPQPKPEAAPTPQPSKADAEASFPESAVPPTERADAAQLEALGRIAAEKARAEEERAAGTAAGTTETSPQPEIGPASPESKPEKEPLPHEQAVIDARAAYSRALLNERRWFNFGNKKELARSLKAYREAKDFAVRLEAEKLKTDFPTPTAELDEKSQAEYTSRLVELAIKYHVEEEGQLRDSLIQPGQKDWVERSRQFMRRHWKARLALGVPLGMAGLGVFVSGVTWAQNIEALLRGGQKIFDQRWGKAQHLSADQVGKIDSLDAAAGRLAATTFDELEYGPEKAKNPKKKTSGNETVVTEAPSRAKTRELLHQRYGELLRQQREMEAHESLKRGESLESVAERVLQESLDSGRTLHQAYLERIHRNKNLSKLRVVASVAGGAVTGVVMNEAVHHMAKSEAAQNVREWFGRLFDRAPDVQAAHPGGSLGDAYRDVADTARTPNWAGIERPVDGTGIHPGLEQAATETAKTAAVSAVETARPGDSVWTMAERYIGEHAAGLSEEQKTWLVDSVKDAVAKDPARFGLENIDRIAVGQTVDFTQAGLNLEALTDQAKHLSADTLESIHQNLTEKAATEATQTASHAPVPGEYYYPGDADNEPYFGPAPESATSPTVPAVEPTPITPAAETISQKIPETLTITPDVARDFDTYRTVALNVPETAMGPFRQSLETISLQQGLEIGPIETALRGLPDVNNADEERMSTALHQLAKSLIGAGHAPNQSMAAGLEWIRVSRH